MDPQDPTKGLKFGPPFTVISIYNQHVTPFKITKADVLGTPRVFVAGPNHYGDTTACSTGIEFESYTIDPQSLALSSQGILFPNLPDETSCFQAVDITTGRFTTATHDQLLVAYGMEGGNVKVLPFDFDAQGNAVQQPIFDTGIPEGIGQAIIRSGRFDWSSPYDQAALLISNGASFPQTNTLRILSFDQNFTTTAGKAFQAGVTRNAPTIWSSAISTTSKPIPAPRRRPPL